MNICVYCGSSSHVDQEYFVLAGELGKQIGEQGHNIVFGGGSCGLMGEVSQCAKDAGADVIGIYPNYFADLKPDYLDEEIISNDLRDRKGIMADRADAFVALPGGLGTLDEIFDILAPKSLHKHTKPLVLINHEGYYDELISFLNYIIAKRFAHDEHLDLFGVVSDVGGVFEYLDSYHPGFEFDDRWPG